MIKLGIFCTHPIQYQVPLWRRLSKNKQFDVKVYYLSKQGIDSSFDPGFGEEIRWDQPLLDGYYSEFLTNVPINNVKNSRIPNFKKLMSNFTFITKLDYDWLAKVTHYFQCDEDHHQRKTRKGIWKILALYSPVLDMRLRRHIANSFWCLAA